MNEEQLRAKKIEKLLNAGGIKTGKGDYMLIVLKSEPSAPFPCMDGK